MKVLFAAPDRDLLECYKKLLAPELGEIVTTFDGTQVLSLIASESFDVAVVDETIPRVAFPAIVARMREKKLPVIGLIHEPVSVSRLTGAQAANAYLSYPFHPEDMVQIIRDTAEKAASEERLDVFGLKIDVGDFRMRNGSYLTGGEIDVLKSLLGGGSVTAGEGAYVSALNVKLAAAGSQATVKYRTKKGFELVRGDE